MFLSKLPVYSLKHLQRGSEVLGTRLVVDCLIRRLHSLVDQLKLVLLFIVRWNQSRVEVASVAA